MQKKILIGLMAMAITGLIYTSVFAYVINGRLDDWGVNPAGFGSSNWIPNPGIHYTEEDQNTWFLNPGYGGQTYDVEAMYIDFDNANLYFAIVTGFPGSGYNSHKPGDIALDFGIDGSYEYGIETTGEGVFTKGSLYSVATWGGASAWGGVSYPTVMITATEIYNPSETNLVYNKTYYGDYGHYVIEGYMPHSYFGSNWGKYFRTHWTMNCGNDAINLDIVPEPATLSLLGLGLLGLVGLRKKKIT